MPPSSAERTHLKLIVNHLSLAAAWVEGEQGHSQGLATISDGLRRVGRGLRGAGEGGWGGLCVTPQLFRRILRVTSTSSRLQNITLITSNAGASPLRLEEFCPNLSLISAIRMHALFQG